MPFRAANVWKNLVHRERVERELDDEIRAAFDLLVHEKIQAGMPPEEARRAATLEMGRVDVIKDQVRDVRAGALVDELVQDARYAIRLLRRSPVFTLTAVLSVAIGIGANSTIFTVANALLLRAPAGVADPDRLVDIGVGRKGEGFNPGSYPDYLDVRRRATAFDGVYATELFGGALSLRETGSGEASERVFGQFVTANFFTVLGAIGARLKPDVPL